MKKLLTSLLFQRSNKNTMPKLVCGFTLIEIVVVIGIMGFLSAIVYSSFDASRAKSRDQKRITDISVIQLALEQYFQKYGVYPVDLSSLVSGNPNIPSGEQVKFLPEIPTDLPKNVYLSQYFPITKDKTGNSNSCISYQLWTNFELQNSYLESKKGFDSTSLPKNGLYECGSSHQTINASTTATVLVYDVMPY